MRLSIFKIHVTAGGISIPNLVFSLRNLKLEPFNAAFICSSATDTLVCSSHFLKALELARFPRPLAKEKSIGS